MAAFALEKDLWLPDPGLAYTIQEENGELVIDLSARALVRFVDLSFPGADAIFSDNFFDLRPGARSGSTAHCPPVGTWSRRART